MQPSVQPQKNMNPLLGHPRYQKVHPVQRIGACALIVVNLTNSRLHLIVAGGFGATFGHFPERDNLALELKV